MTRSLHGWLAATCLLLAITGSAPAQGKFGEQAPDFPPGSFTDGKAYRLADYDGKLVVLYFFEPQ